MSAIRPPGRHVPDQNCEVERYSGHIGQLDDVERRRVALGDLAHNALDLDRSQARISWPLLL
jgi:hypothetical protein